MSGTSAVAFAIHTTIGPIIKQNKEQKHNTSNLKIAYFVAFFMYLAISLLGSMGILGTFFFFFMYFFRLFYIGRQLYTKEAENITDYFE